jgi:hypothetical protein
MYCDWFSNLVAISYNVDTACSVFLEGDNTLACGRIIDPEFDA